MFKKNKNKKIRHNFPELKVTFSNRFLFPTSGPKQIHRSSTSKHLTFLLLMCKELATNILSLTNWIID